MLQRSSQVGEFYRMSPPANWVSTEKLPANYMDIMIYDEESDRHVHVPFEQALKATTWGSAEVDDDGTPGTVVKGDVFHFKNMAKDVKDKCNKSMGVLGESTEKTAMERITGSTVALGDWLQARYDDNGKLNAGAVTEADIREVIILAVRAGAWVPVEIVIARPFMEHLMLSAIVAVAGRETGATLFGPADMQISANTSVKTIEGYARTCQHTCKRAQLSA